ncbi:MAG: hypothetical protein L0Y66_18425, partial [Myxococcaceae bacterium]|nr:hypothetical protein [Myxococcaceae bacterium]
MTDMLSLVEAAYRFELTDAECLHEMARSAGALESFHPVLASSNPLPQEGSAVIPTPHVAGVRTEPEHLALPHISTEYVPISTVRRALECPPVRTNLAELFQVPTFERILRASGFPEVAGLFCPVDPYRAICIVALLPESRPTHPAERRAWAPVAAHVSAAWRLRWRLQEAEPGTPSDEAVLTPDGRCVHAEVTSRDRSAREALREAVVARERRRARASRHVGRAFWPELVAGRWTLVDRFEA